MASVFVELSLIIVLAAVFAYLASTLRQPLLLGYILAGIIIGPQMLDLVTAQSMVETLSQVGVALLLFMVGLQLNPRMIRDMGRVALYAGLGQILFTTVIGYLIAQFFFTKIVALYVAIAITFSSTIIIMKLLSDKGELQSLYGRVAMGILLVQDIVAVLLLMMISASGTGMQTLTHALLSGIGLLALLTFTGRYVLPLVDGYLSRSIELLFLCSIAWCLAWAALFEFVGFSIEIGALMAGVALSMTDYGAQISARIRPLRDFFVVLFFILLGSQFSFTALSSQEVYAAFALSAFIIVGNPLIIMVIMRALRFPRHAGFLCGLTCAQISEFSLILIALGTKMGHLPAKVTVIMTIIALMTIGISSYLILYGDRVYHQVGPYLNVFEPKRVNAQARASKRKYKAILFGYNRIGYDLMDPLASLPGDLLVIDYNPEVVEELQEEDVNCIYGDADDVTLLEEVNLRSPKLFVSTIPNLDTNLNIIRNVRKVNKRAIIMVVSHQIKHALQLYDAGANFVLLPHFIGGRYAAQLIRRNKTRKRAFDREKKRQIKYLLDRMEKGHEHPLHES